MGRNWSDREVENLLRQAVGRSVPDVYQQVSRVTVDPLLNLDHIVPPPRPPRRRWKRALLILGALLLVALCVWLFFRYRTAAILSVGDGPDVELSVNRFGQVLEASGRSDAGETLLTGLSLEGEDLDDAVERLGWSMANAGYLSNGDVPLAVDGGDWQYNREVLEDARDSLEDVLEDWGGGGHVVTAPVTSPAPDGSLPTQTPAGTVTSTPAAQSTVPAAQPSTAVPAVQPTTPSGGTQSSLLSEEAAKSAALSHAGLNGADVTFTKVKLDQDDGQTLYELEFLCGGARYDYEVDAYTGAIWKSERVGSPNLQTITAAQAEAIALQHAGLSAGQVVERKSELDDDDGVLHYQVEFKRNGVEYEYEIDAVSGAILKAERD